MSEPPKPITQLARPPQGLRFDSPGPVQVNWLGVIALLLAICACAGLAFSFLADRFLPGRTRDFSMLIRHVANLASFAGVAVVATIALLRRRRRSLTWGFAAFALAVALAMLGACTYMTLDWLSR